MGIEGQNQGGSVMPAGRLDNLAQESSVAEVMTVKITNGDDRIGTGSRGTIAARNLHVDRDRSKRAASFAK